MEVDAAMGEKNKVLIWVESLRGSGHMRVVSTLQKKLQAEGMEVHIATSSRHFAENFDFDGVHWHAMPTFDAADPKSVEARTEFLRETYRSLKPASIITENWPLGRAEFDPELTALMEQAHASAQPPKIFSLSREILFGGIARTEQDMQKAAELVRKYYDNVIVLGPRGFPGLELSFPAVKAFEDKVFYAGYMSESVPPRDKTLDDAAREVVVSVGGGVTEHGYKLLQCAMRAHGLTKNAHRPLHLFVPNGYHTTYLADGTSWFDRLKTMAGELNAARGDGAGAILIENNTPEYLNHLSNAAMSISQGGSNTAIEVASAEDVDGMPGQLPVPVKDMGALCSEAEMTLVNRNLRCSVVGSATTVKAGLAEFIERTQPDEVIATAMIHDHKARMRSFEILAENI